MTIDTDITRADWAALVGFVTRNASKGWSARLETWLIALAVGGVIGVTFSLAGIEIHVPSMAAGFLGGLVMLIVLSRLRMRRIAPATDGFILGPRKVSLDDDGLRETSQRHESVFRWQAVRSVELTDQHVFLLVDANGALIVPRRAFPSEVECNQFVDEARRRSGKTAT